MKLEAAIGFRVHSGWASLAALGDKGPRILIRRRIELVEPGQPLAKQPYHAARELGAVDGARLVKGVAARAERMAGSALAQTERELTARGFRLSACGLLVSAGRPPGALAAILASHALIHAAEGVLFRNAVAKAALKQKIHVLEVVERELHTSAQKTLGLSQHALETHLATFRKEVGAPFGQDEKFASLVAWLALAE